jgi:hypothetical protein
MVFWEQAINSATVPQHPHVVLLSQRDDPPSAITAFCLDLGHLKADLHILSLRSIYVAANALITMLNV